MAAIRRNIELEGRLIDDLLDLTRIARGKLKLELKPIDAHEAISHVVEMCQVEAAEKRLRVELDVRAADSWVAADAAKFQALGEVENRAPLEQCGEGGIRRQCRCVAS